MGIEDRERAGHLPEVQIIQVETGTQAKGEGTMNELVGKTIVAVFRSSEDTIIFKDSIGALHEYTVDGDCCSTSWWLMGMNVQSLIGKTITSVLHDSRSFEFGTRQERDISDVFALNVETYNAYTIFEHRNSSNGYYSGDVSYRSPAVLPEDAVQVTEDHWFTP